MTIIEMLEQYTREKPNASVLFDETHTKGITYSKLDDMSMDTGEGSLIQDGRILDYLLCNYSCRHNRERKTTGEMTTAARILAIIPFEGGCEVGMTRTRHDLEERVIA